MTLPPIRLAPHEIRALLRDGFNPSPDMRWLERSARPGHLERVRLDQGETETRRGGTAIIVKQGSRRGRAPASGSGSGALAGAPRSGGPGATFRVEIDEAVWSSLSRDAYCAGADDIEFGASLYGTRRGSTFHVVDTIHTVWGTTNRVVLHDSPPGLSCCDDELLGSVHSHPGRARRLSDVDLRSAEGAADERGGPELSLLLTVGANGSWLDPTVDAWVTRYDLRSRTMRTDHAHVTLLANPWSS